MKIIITILVVMLGIGGGAYYAQDSGMYDFSQLKQYIPGPVKEVLNIKEEADIISLSSSELEIIESQQTKNPQTDIPEVFRDTQPTDKMVDEQQMQVSNLGDNLLEKDQGKPSVDAAPVVDLAETSIDSTTQLAVNDQIAEKAPAKKMDVQVLDASPEEMKMVQELNKAEAKIVNLDNENEKLQSKYHQMVKKNRELALKIKEIDHQIKMIESQKLMEASN